MIYNASLEGAMFKTGSKRVLTILKELTIGTDAEAWMKGIKCERLTMIALQTRYDGPRRKKETSSLFQFGQTIL